MDDALSQALLKDMTIDITTIGRKSGEPRRIEIWFHNIEGRLYITGTPGPRGWYANLLKTPEFTFHLKESVAADISAKARPITSATERRPIIEAILEKLDRDLSEVDERMQGCPLIEVTLAID